MKFDATISLGHLLTVVALLLGGTAAYTNIQIDLAELKTIATSSAITDQDHENRLRILERDLMKLDK